MSPKNSNDALTRRSFIQKSTVAAAGTVAALRAPFVHAVGSEDMGIRIGVIGCGGRGTGAVLDALGAAYKSVYPATGYHTEDVIEGESAKKGGIQVIALADMFGDRIERCNRNLNKIGLGVPTEHCYVGFDAHKQLLAHPEINYVILATPPHFRPLHAKAAIEAGKNVFMEKPGAVDVPGVKTLMEVGELARQKNLGIAAGTQRRHMPGYREAIRRIHDGAIGDIVFAKCYWNGGTLWVVDRQPNWSDVEWQIKNWNYFTWLSGDHIVEQHIHNLDVMNWVLGAHPIKATSGLGGRQARRGERNGNVYDHFAVEYEYPGGITMFSQCRQIDKCKTLVGEFVAGTKGKSNCADFIDTAGGESWRYTKKAESPYRLEHENLIASIRAGEPLNEAQALAESTMTGIIGREAVYSGQEVLWDEAMKSTKQLGPDKYEFGPYPIQPVAVPGDYRLS